MDSPTVSFVVPCYKLGHLLQECVDSILAQTYSNFEVLIMDDCSPDQTQNVATSFDDPRVKYIRNEQNLGHLPNYNKGIELSRGEYVWLISADDRLRRRYVLERYVELMEKHPNVGYVCCPGIGLHDGRETGLVSCGYFGPRNRIVDGRKFIALSLKKGYGLLAPSVMVRRDCYDKVSKFPLDMPHQGDWYLWFRWALEYDVAYLCEAMVNYRDHDLNIMKDLFRRVPDTVFRDEVNVLWRTKQHCEQKRIPRIAEKCGRALADRYARAAASATYADMDSARTLSIEECDESLHDGASSELEYRRLSAMFRAYLGNVHWHHGDYIRARRSYGAALARNWGMPRVWIKILLLLAGFGRLGLLLKGVHLAKDRGRATAADGSGATLL